MKFFKNPLIYAFTLLVLLTAFSYFAKSDAVIFSGNDVKTLKYNIDLFGRSKILATNSDPSTSSGLAAPLASIATDYLTGNVYLKTASADTGWTKLQDAASTVTSTVTAGGSTSLSCNSSQYQVFTGSSNQTVVLPDARNCLVGTKFIVYNNSTGIITVNRNTGTLRKAVQATGHSIFLLTSGATQAGLWTIDALADTGLALTNSTGPVLTLSDGTGSYSLTTVPGSSNKLSFVTGGSTEFLSSSTAGALNLPLLTASLPLQLNSSKDIISAQVSLTTGVTGTLPLGNGGIGITSGTSGGIPYFSSTSTVASSGLLTANQLVLGGGAGATPSSLGSLGTTTTVLHGNASGAPSFGAVSLTGDVSGVLPIANGGTNSTATATAGGVGYGTGTAHAYTSAGTSGFPLISAAASAPSFAQLNISSGTNVTGTLAVGNGGTGQTSYTDGQLLIGNSTGNTLAKATLTGTSNQVVVTNGSGTITLSTPQSIGTGSSPTFAGLTVGSLSGPVKASAGVLSASAINLSGSEVTSTLAVGNGGTGLTAGTSGGITYFSSTSGMASSGLLTSSALILGGGTGGSPTSLALGTANQMLGMNSGASANEYKTLSAGTSGTDFAIAHSANAIAFNLPDASATARGVVTTGAQTLAGAKTLSTAPILSSLTASLPLKLDASKNVTAAAIDLSGAEVTGILPNANTTATSANTNSAIVARNGSGNFSAGTITAALTGTASGNTTYTANNHGVVVSGSGNAMTVIAPDASTTKVLTSGGSSADPTWADVASAPSSSQEMSNIGLASSVSGNALTISLKQADGSTNCASGSGACKIGMPSSTITSGLYNQRTVTGALSFTFSSGSTAGQVSGNIARLYIYLIDNAGTEELAVAQVLFQENQLISTTAEGGAGGADSGNVMYSTTARSNVPFRVIGFLDNTQSVAGTWTSVGSKLRVGSYGSVCCETVAMLYKGVPTGTLNGSVNIATFPTKVLDTHNLYSSGTYQIPISGTYDISSSSYITFGSTTASQLYEFMIYIDGSLVYETVPRAETITATDISADLSVKAIPLLAGQLVTIRTATTVTSPAYGASGTQHWVSISRSGNYQ